MLHISTFSAKKQAGEIFSFQAFKNETVKPASVFFFFGPVKQFLSYFNEDIIMVDNTHADETEDNKFYGYIDHPEIFEEIYIN